jgi:hypothetical protein
VKAHDGIPPRWQAIDDDDEDTPPAGYVPPPPAWESRAVSKKVAVILEALDIPKIDPAARSTLQRWVYRADKIFGGDRGDILLTLRAIVESEGNGPEALLEPILCAVHSVCRPEFTVKGLAFIESFDRIDLRALLQQMRDLKCFTKSDLSTYFAAAIRSRLREILGVPAQVPAPPKKPPVGRSTVRPKDVSERSWSDVMALRKRKPKQPARAA